MSQLEHNFRNQPPTLFHRNTKVGNSWHDSTLKKQGSLSCFTFKSMVNTKKKKVKIIIRVCWCTYKYFFLGFQSASSISIEVRLNSNSHRKILH